MRQHYVPRVYLQGFVDPVTPPGEEPSLWLWDAEDQRVSRRSPRNIAREADFYEVVGVSRGPGAGIEARLAAIESQVRAEIDRLQAEGVRAFGFDERLLWFLATLSVRTPWARQALARHFTAHPNASDTISGLAERERWAASVEYLASWAAEYFRRMGWILIGPSETSDSFLTSDRPVVLTSDSMTDDLLDVSRLTEASAVVTVPLTASLALIGSYQRDSFLHTGVTVQWMNCRTARSAERYVFMPRAGLSEFVRRFRS